MCKIIQRPTKDTVQLGTDGRLSVQCGKDMLLCDIGLG